MYTDVARRYAEHAAGKGARYTRSHPPLLLAQFEYPDRAAASRAKHAIKQLTPGASGRCAPKRCSRQHRKTYSAPVLPLSPLSKPRFR